MFSKIKLKQKFREIAQVGMYQTDSVQDAWLEGEQI